MVNFLKKNWGIFFIFLFSITTLLPLFHSGFFSMHDDTQVARVFEMGKSLRDGMVPVRWVQDLGFGYGYPIFTFYAPLAFYVGGVLTLFSISALLSTKIVIGIGIILSGIFMYYFARDIWGESGGVLSGLLYLYAPYHALDIYVRGDVAEFWAYTFLPLALWGIWKCFKTQKMRYVLLGAIGFAGIILSHNLTAFMVTPFIIIFIISLIFFSKKKLLTAYKLISIIFLGLFLSAFYWLPVPFELQYTNVLSQVIGGADFHKNFVCLSQLWNSPWGYGGSIPGCIDGISFALGKIYIGLLLISIILLPFVFKKDKGKSLFILGSALGVMISLFLLLEISKPIWDAVHVLSFLQYPWRFLLLVFFFISFMSGSILWYVGSLKLNKNYAIKFILLLIISLGVIFIQGKYFIPQTYYNVTNDYYTNNLALEWKVSQITSEYMPKGFDKPTTQTKLASNLFTTTLSAYPVVLVKDKTQEKELKVNFPKKEKLFINLAYFPGWIANLDGKSVNITKEKSGMSILIPSGSHLVRIVYQDTFVEKIGDYITLLSLFTIIIGIIYLGHKKKL